MPQTGSTASRSSVGEPSERAATRRAPRGRQPRSPAVGAVPGRPAGLRIRASASSSSPLAQPVEHDTRAPCAGDEADVAGRRGEGGFEPLLVAAAHRREHDRVRGDPEIVRDPPADPGDELTQAAAAGLSPITATRGVGSCGSMSTSTVPSDAHELSAITTSSPPCAAPSGRFAGAVARRLRARATPHG